MIPPNLASESANPSVSVSGESLPSLMLSQSTIFLTSSGGSPAGAFEGCHRKARGTRGRENEDEDDRY